jgi:6-oxo-cyclohex-1-ene-carbonyl-CoA hydrolase
VHGSAPDGGATDFLDLYVGYARAAESLVLCDEPWSAHKAMRLNLVNEIVPVYRQPSGEFLPNPLAITDRYIDGQGRIVYGEWKTGAERQAAQDLIARCRVDLSLLDAACERLATRLLYTFPDCTRKTIESLRKKKLLHWQLNAETNRSWLALNMHTEAAIGFRAFHYADRKEREADFIALRRRLAEGARWSGELVREALPPSARARLGETVHAG